MLYTSVFNKLPKTVAKLPDVLLSSQILIFISKESVELLTTKSKDLPVISKFQVNLIKLNNQLKI